MLRTLGVAALAATASAILLPPGMARVAGSASGPGALALVDPFSQVVEVACPGCLYGQPKEDGGFTWAEGVENSLYVNISVGADPETLELNGVQIYPPIDVLSNEVAAPYITQAPRDTSFNEIKKNADHFAHLRLTSWSFSSTKVKVAGDLGEELVKIRFSMKALEGAAIEVEDLCLDVLNTSAGLMLIKAEKAAPLTPAEECSSFPLLCQWRAYLSNKLGEMRNKFKGGKCQKGANKHGHGRPHPHGHHGQMGAQNEGEGKKFHHHHHGEHKDRPHHNKMGHHKGAHGHHHGPHPHHQALHKVAQFLLVVVIPILVGILVGMLTYLVGMLIGTGIALLWARYGRSRRSRRGAYQPVALEEGDVLVVSIEDEKEVVPIEVYSDAPPQYIEKEQAQE